MDSEQVAILFGKRYEDYDNDDEWEKDKED